MSFLKHHNSCFSAFLIVLCACSTEDQGVFEPPPESPLIMLTPTEYNNTVQDLLGFSNAANNWPAPDEVGSSAQSSWPWFFPEEAGVQGFEGLSNGQTPSPYQIEQLYKAAAHFARFAIHSPLFYTCDNTESLSEGDLYACGRTSIEQFAIRAWRRPLTSDEQLRIRTFWEDNISEGSFEDAIQISAAAILQSPQFLYRSELGALAQPGQSILLNDWELASKLSYFLWDSMPDEQLFAAAARNELHTQRQLEFHARRMLQDDRARSAIVHFHKQWLGATDLSKVSPARSVYGPLYYDISAEPEFSSIDGTPEDFEWPNILIPLRASMDIETDLFIERTIFDGNGSFSDLLSDNHGYFSKTTRPLYGEDTEQLSDNPLSVTTSTGERLALYPAAFPKDQRAGLLTLPSTLALLSHPVHPAPILRGTFVLKQLACQNLGTPPPGAESEAPPDSIDAQSTNRERTEAVTSAASCASCHDNINPPGFAFEHYDAIGGWRDEDNGLPVDSSGTMTLPDGTQLSFTNAVELSRQLAQSSRVRDCYTLKWTSYATGISIDWNDTSIVPIQNAFRQNDNIQDLLVTIAGSSVFRYRAEDL